MQTSVQERPSNLVVGKVYDFEKPLKCRCESGADGVFASGTFRSGNREGGTTLVFYGRPTDNGEPCLFGVPIGTRMTRRD
ncbi:MAG TPA: hypothetical protein VEA92_00010 [Candidatus Paceibacterota bacterium]|nr:hypothetical protein [Candidatus Paceibacterota bacterium]